MNIRKRLNESKRTVEEAPRSYDDVGDLFAHLAEKEQQAKAIVPAADGTIAVGKFRLTATGIEISGDFTEDEANELGEFLKSVDESQQWWRGDWANSYVPADANQYEASEIYKELAEKFGIKAKTLKNYAYVCRNVPSSLRKDALSFSHHNLVVGRDDMETLLQWAADEDVSVKALRERIKEIDNPTPPAPPSKTSVDNPHNSTVNAFAVGDTVRLHNGLEAEVLEIDDEGWLMICYAESGITTAAPIDSVTSVLPIGLLVQDNITLNIGRLADVLQQQAKLMGDEQKAAMYIAAMERISQLATMTYEDCRNFDSRTELDRQLSSFLTAITVVLDDVQILVEQVTAEALSCRHES